MNLSANVRFYVCGFILVLFFYGEGVAENITYPDSALYEPHKLTLGKQYRVHSVAVEGVAAEYFFPVSITKISQNVCVVANYRNLLLLDLEKNTAKILIPPELDTAWTPTGVFYNNVTNTLYVANYKGRNVLVCRIREDGSLNLLRQIRHSAMRGPENVAVSKNGNYVAVADYDANALLLFFKDALLWEKEIFLAHGVAFSNGDNGVFVTGLAAPYLFNFDLKGKKLAGGRYSAGWGKNKFLYPTTIAVWGDESLVIDARSGQLSLFNKENLEEILSIGGMGLDTTLFDLPYGVTWDRKNVVLVADTVNGRIARIDIEAREILEAWYLNDGVHGQKQQTYLGNIDLSNDIKRAEGQLLYSDKADFFSGESASCCNNYKTIDSEHAPLGVNTFMDVTFQQAVIVDKSSSVGLSALFRDTLLSNSRWFRGLTGFVVVDGGLSLLADGLNPLFSRDYGYYFFAHNFTVNGKLGLLISSPGLSEVFVIFDGLCVSLPVSYGSWMEDEKLLSHHKEYSIEKIMKEGLSLIDIFQSSSLVAGNRVELIRKTFFSNWSEATFLKILEDTFTSKAGKEFFVQYCTQKSHVKQKVLKQQFLKSCLQQKIIHMGEYFLVNLLTYEKEPR